MSDDGLPEFVLAGTTKAASTWIYECFEDHPDIATHTDDTLCYFDMNRHRNIDWYRDQFDPSPQQVVGEASPTYMYSAGTPKRIADTLPDVDLVFCLRNPVDRAFSHWWHGYSEGLWNYEFDAAIEEPPPYQMWIEPGYYDQYLETFEDHFDRDQMHVWLFDDLVADSESFITEIFDTVGVDSEYIPTPVGNTSNEARSAAPDMYQDAVRWMRKNISDEINSALRPAWESFRWLIEDTSPYEGGIDPEVRAELEHIYADDMRALSSRLSRDLDHWFNHIEL
jgi:hypothetical protein